MVGWPSGHQNQPTRRTEEWIYLIPKDKAVYAIDPRSFPKGPICHFPTPFTLPGDWLYKPLKYISDWLSRAYMTLFSQRKHGAIWFSGFFQPLKSLVNYSKKKPPLLGILKDEGKSQIWSPAGLDSIGAGTGGAATKASGRDEWGDSCTQIGRGVNGEVNVFCCHLITNLRYVRSCKAPPTCRLVVPCYCRLF